MKIKHKLFVECRIWKIENSFLVLPSLLIGVFGAIIRSHNFKCYAANCSFIKAKICMFHTLKRGYFLQDEVTNLSNSIKSFKMKIIFY